jgi:glycerol kinase
VDGGVALNNPLMQFQASLSGVVIDRPVSVETTAQGAAWLAALHAGYYGSLHEVLALRKTAARFSPQPAALRPEAYAHWKQAVQRSLAWSHT